jgi:hypothetical protein
MVSLVGEKLMPHRVRDQDEEWCDSPITRATPSMTRDDAPNAVGIRP